ncbi:hypothetical protein PHMEG_00020725 [Phytophthora megakarya]|uniref:DDE Tnp4 domain-containing protein n=1 Tax=Phytophthora megakarya TaxID=4795 RepID=A0A225VNM9_9STRA|nr:hypothetical protein PHMEG_00020725 [Phytophthora megakarya]
MLWRLSDGNYLASWSRFQLGSILLVTTPTRTQRAAHTVYQTTNGKSYKNNSFNFHLSQLRIRVEMAFGLLVNKWRIFKAPPRVGVKSVKNVVHVACILHNFCIDERLRESHCEDVDDDEDMAAILASKPVPDSTDLTVGVNDTSAY